MDLLAALISGGQSTVEIGQQETEYGVSQVFVAFDLRVARPADQLARLLNESIDDLHASIPVEPGRRVRYPGEGALHTREEYRRLGIPVDEAIWAEILHLKHPPEPAV